MSLQSKGRLFCRNSIHLGLFPQDWVQVTRNQQERL